MTNHISDRAMAAAASTARRRDARLDAEVRAHWRRRYEQGAREELRARDEAIAAKAAAEIQASRERIAAAGAVAPEVEERAAPATEVVDVRRGQRIITMLAVPFEQATRVPYRGETWSEIFTRSAFNGLDVDRQRVPVSAVLRAPAFDHNDGHLVGRLTHVHPDTAAGLVVDATIVNTPAGDETLELAGNNVLSPSVGFAVRGADQQLDRRVMMRRVNRAFLDHVSLVPTPAYPGAKVLAMRAAPPATINLDDPVLRWARERTAEATSRTAMAEARAYLQEHANWQRQRDLRL